MKNNEKKENKNPDLAKRFELDENAMNQIVGGTFFWTEATPGTDLLVSDSGETFITGTEAMLTCDPNCKSCVSHKNEVTINICKSKFKK